MCAVSLSVQLPAAFRRQEGRQQSGGGGGEGGSVDKFQCLAFPPGNPKLGLAPPSLPVSFKHVPSKSPSLQTPPVEPSPDLLPRRPTFLRLATLKVPAQARTQILPPCPPPVHIQMTRNTQRHGWTQRPPVHTGGSTWSASDPSSQTSTNTAMYSHSLPSAYRRLKHAVSSTQTRTNAVTHRPGHAEKQVQTRSIVPPCTAQPPPPPLPPPPCAGASQAHNTVPPVLLCTQPSIHGRPHRVTPCVARDNTRSAGYRDPACPCPGHVH